MGRAWIWGNRERQAGTAPGNGKTVGTGSTKQAQHPGAVGTGGIGKAWIWGNWEHRAGRASGNGKTVGTGQLWAPGNRKTMGTRELGDQAGTTPGKWETGGTGQLWAPGNGKSVDTGEPGAPGNWETAGTGQLWAPGNGKMGGTGSTGQAQHRGAVGTEERENCVDFKMKTIEVDGIKVRIQIWDTAGQERYQTITKQYYRRAQGIFLVYDISSERSYQHIVKWASDVDEYAPDGVQKILIGNKADEEHKRQVAKEQGLQLAREYGMDFYETSACSNLNIKEAHRKELEGLRGPPRTPTLARLDEDEQQPLGSEDNPKACWC
ncbi:ras-related protein Rab-15 isoform X2 [Tyto alba]|uniref:ras-related protein Rab-15 isoform X2 n=1 Tax=Tyto alba TaxID=56313 RepID=UPI001C676613|nr:ras-related protein Rab-15 isoform X2 [Tyto alba]